MKISPKTIPQSFDLVAGGERTRGLKFGEKPANSGLFPVAVASTEAGGRSEWLWVRRRSGLGRSGAVWWRRVVAGLVRMNSNG
ncbi:hypothetical protein ACE6H2_002185 [Prunus campanulata]